MKTQNTLKLILCFCLVAISSYMPAIEDTQTTFKAKYMYSFTKSIEWPAASKQGNFIVGVLGNSPIYGKMAEIAATKKVVNQTIEVKTFANAASITNCHLLFVPSNVDNMQDVLGKLKKSYTLIVTEKPGFVKQGSVINFIVKDNRLAYEVNKVNAEKYDLKVGAQLLTTAAAVIE